ncbi:hypothetical protein EDD15DRAFT_1634381 [Pisolithus albus]|nr:hypothetical protein EDD15DRAFT_1634381 [Pisolithus albus]
MLAHAPCLLESNEGSRKYTVRDFLRVAGSVKTEMTISACDLYRVPSLSSWRHEFLLVHVEIGVDREKLMLIIERFPGNNAIRAAVSDGGIAKDTITVMRARESHGYWQRVGQPPKCRGTLRWSGRPPHLLDIITMADAASTTFKYYNCYVRQCYWYARVILASMAEAFPSCTTEGTTSFANRRFAVFGAYKISQVQALVNLQTVYGGGKCLRPPPLIVTPDSLRTMRSHLAGYLKNCLAQLPCAQPAAVIVNRCCGRTLGREPNAAGGWT